MKRIVAGIVVALVCATVALAATSGPIALDWHKGGYLYVLLKDGSVSILDGATKRKRATIPSLFGMVPVEIFSARLKDREYVFVSGFWGRSGSVWQYTAEGQPYARYETPEQAASFDIDPDRRVLYLASPVTNVLYSINLDQKGSSAKRVVYLRDAEGAGPVIFDRGRNRVMLGDTGHGVMYDIDVSNGSYRQVASGLGRPISFDFDATSTTLYLAESLQGRIFVFRLENGTFKQADVIPTGLRRLSGLTIGPDDALFVADATSVYHLSLKTKKLSRFAH